MISPLSVTDRYILQPALIAKHRSTLDWLSATVLWKSELSFFQKLLDQYACRFSTEEDKKQIGHYQSIITYYGGDLVPYATTRLRLHEKKLATILENKDESDTEYFSEHDALMGELQSMSTQLADYKIDFFKFIEKAL